MASKDEFLELLNDVEGNIINALATARNAFADSTLLANPAHATNRQAILSVFDRQIVRSQQLWINHYKKAAERIFTTWQTIEAEKAASSRRANNVDDSDGERADEQRERRKSSDVRNANDAERSARAVAELSGEKEEAARLGGVNNNKCLSAVVDLPPIAGAVSDFLSAKVKENRKEAAKVLLDQYLSSKALQNGISVNPRPSTARAGTSGNFDAVTAKETDENEEPYQAVEVQQAVADVAGTNCANEVEGNGDISGPGGDEVPSIKEKILTLRENILTHQATIKGLEALRKALQKDMEPLRVCLSVLADNFKQYAEVCCDGDVGVEKEVDIEQVGYAEDCPHEVDHALTDEGNKKESSSQDSSQKERGKKQGGGEWLLARRINRLQQKHVRSSVMFPLRPIDLILSRRSVSAISMAKEKRENNLHRSGEEGTAFADSQKKVMKRKTVAHAGGGVIAGREEGDNISRMLLKIAEEKKRKRAKRYESYQRVRKSFRRIRVENNDECVKMVNLLRLLTSPSEATFSVDATSPPFGLEKISEQFDESTAAYFTTESTDISSSSTTDDEQEDEKDFADEANNRSEMDVDQESEANSQNKEVPPDSSAALDHTSRDDHEKDAHWAAEKRVNFAQCGADKQKFRKTSSAATPAQEKLFSDRRRTEPRKPTGILTAAPRQHQRTQSPMRNTPGSHWRSNSSVTRSPAKLPSNLESKYRQPPLEESIVNEEDVKRPRTALRSTIADGGMTLRSRRDSLLAKGVRSTVLSAIRPDRTSRRTTFR